MTCLSFSPCGKYLATGARSGPVALWNVLSNHEIGTFKSLGGSFRFLYLMSEISKEGISLFFFL